MYTAEQRARREASRWTPVMMITGLAQFIFFITGLYLALRFLFTDRGYGAATVGAVANIALYWINTGVGMLWEKDMYGRYFMCREFFREDLGNLIALIAFNAYFVARLLGWSQQAVVAVVLVAYFAYCVNFSQWILKYYQGRRAKKREGCNCPSIPPQHKR